MVFNEGKIINTNYFYKMNIGSSVIVNLDDSFMLNNFPEKLHETALDSVSVSIIFSTRISTWFWIRNLINPRLWK